MRCFDLVPSEDEWWAHFKCDVCGDPIVSSRWFLETGEDLCAACFREWQKTTSGLFVKYDFNEKTPEESLAFDEGRQRSMDSTVGEHRQQNKVKPLENAEESQRKIITDKLRALVKSINDYLDVLDAA